MKTLSDTVWSQTWYCIHIAIWTSIGRATTADTAVSTHGFVSDAICEPVAKATGTRYVDSTIYEIVKSEKRAEVIE
jgi:hypothetical protein